jgi:hypothetical protein
MAKKNGEFGFIVRFMNVGRMKLNWEQRIERPVDEVAIVTAIKKRKALMSKEVSAPYVDDYGGRIYAGVREVGSYVIVPGSEVMRESARSAPRSLGR